MKSRIFLFVFINILGFATQRTQAQAIYKTANTIPIIQFADTLNFAFLGGWNNPEFSNIDWNNDGIQDLYVFDRGTKLSYALVQDQNGEFHSEENYLKHLPKGLLNWAFLRDYNKDGIADLICYTPPSCVGIYKGVRISTQEIDFQCIEYQVQYGSSTSTSGAIGVSSIDLPGIEDIDGDGDLDLLCFNNMGTTINYYRNVQVELLGGYVQDTLSFVIDKYCWGEIFDNNYPAVTENYPCVPALPTTNDFTIKNLKHSGNTLALMDVDSDGDMDCLKGNITYNTLNLMTNTGTASVAHIAGQDTTFPSYDIPLHCDLFPGAYFVDVNNDQLLDCIASPNLAYATENYHSSHLYLNTGTNNLAHFTFSKDTFLIEEQMDFGESSFPVFEDIDGDGLLDLVVGGNGYYQASGNYLCGLAYYHNVGSIRAPSFEMLSRDWQNFQSLGLKGMAPTFGDLDNDGDRDMIAGTTDGRLNYFTKQANGTYILSQAYFQNIDVGENAAPQLVDVDEDGLLDLLIGEKYGNINYYHNTGSINAAQFSLVTTNFGKVDVRENGNLTGFSTPHLCRLKQGDARTLLVGNESGHVQRYSNIDQNLSGAFTLAESHFSQLALGGPASVFTSNLIGNDTSELALGMYGGGMQIRIWDNSTINSTSTIQRKFQFYLYPNPSNTQCSLLASSIINEIRIVNVYGQTIANYSIHSQQFSFPTTSLSEGTYIILVSGKDFTSTQRLIVAH